MGGGNCGKAAFSLLSQYRPGVEKRWIILRIKALFSLFSVNWMFSISHIKELIWKTPKTYLKSFRSPRRSRRG